MLNFIKTYSKCNVCNFKENVKIHTTFPDIVQYEIFIIGQGPSDIDEITQIPFTGPDGKVLFSLLKAIGINKNQVYVGNLISCSTPNKREPSKLEISCCHERLKAEIKYIKPKLIISLGKIPLYSLTGQTDQQATLGSLFPLLPEWEYECNVLSQLNPDFIRKQRQWINRAVEVFSYIKLYFDNKPKFYNEIAIDHNPEFILEPSIGRLKDYFNNLNDDIIIDYDIETTGLNPRKDNLLGIAFCKDNKIAVSTSIGKNDYEKFEFIGNILQSPSIGKSAQNGSFDYSFLIPKGIKVNPIVWDTRIAEIFINPDLPKDLQTMRARYTRIPPYKPSKKEMKTIAHWNSDKINKMGCMDVLSTQEVRIKQKQLMNEKELFLMNDLFIPLIEVFEYMERQGVSIDVDKLKQYQNSLNPKIDVLKNWIMKKCNINPGSPKQIVDYFKFKDSREDTLNYHIGRNHSQENILRGILKYRQLNKTKGTYLDGIINRMIYERAHTHYKIEGTGTGRPSSENPNLANVPKEMRIIYKPDNTDYLFIEADYKQLELRTGGLIAPEPELLRRLSEGIDPHEIMRQQLFGGTETGNQRRIAKEVVFGTLYGKSPRGLAIQWGISIKEAENLQQLCINQYPGFIKYKNRNDNLVRNGEPLETPFGMRRKVSSYTQGYNSPNQSTAAIVGLYGVKNLYYAGLDIRLTVYDSFLVQVPKINYMKWVMYIKEILEQPFEVFNGYKFPVDIKIGSNWYNMKEIKV